MKQGIGLVVLLVGCTITSDKPSTSKSDGRPRAARALSEHGVAIGQRVPPIPVSCADRTNREVGGGAGLQLITFATAHDCALCNLHLASLKTIDWTQFSFIDPFIVAWGPSRADLAKLESQDMIRDLPLPVCIDRPGVLWDSLDIAHTPFTVIIRRGKIIQVYDQDLSREAYRDQFLKDLSTLPPPIGGGSK